MAEENRKSFTDEELDEFVAGLLRDERRRVCELLDSHAEAMLTAVLQRLKLLIENGTDLQDEMSLAPEDRVHGFTWPDEEE